MGVLACSRAPLFLLDKAEAGDEDGGEGKEEPARSCSRCDGNEAGEQRSERAEDEAGSELARSQLPELAEVDGRRDARQPRSSRSRCRACGHQRTSPR